MTLNRYGKLIRWAYMFEDNVPPYVSLCSLFWRTVLITPVKLLFTIGLFGSVVFLAIYWTVQATFITHGWIWVAAVIVGLLIYLFKDNSPVRSYVEDVGDKVSNSIWAEAAYGIKNKVCPIIYLEGK